MTLEVHIIGIDNNGEQIDLTYNEDELENCIYLLETLNNDIRRKNIEDN